MDEQLGRFDRIRYGLYRRFGLNSRKRRTLRRSVGYVGEAVASRVRILSGRDQRIDIGGRSLVLPPEHRLPYYRRRDHSYDVHAAELLAAAAAGADRVAVIDVGANVGDTALAALTAADNIAVTAVEGNPVFAGYARCNLAPFGDRAVVREEFVGPVRGVDNQYRSGDGSGGFSATAGGEEIPVSWVSPQELLDQLEPAELVVWKSDIDGFDIHVLVDHWGPIVEACEVIWFEYDPISTLGEPADTAELVERIGETGRGMVVFDNLGNRMLGVSPGDDVAGALRDLTGWLYEQRAGHVMVRYFDIWLVTEPWWSTLHTVGRQPNPAVDEDR